MGLTAAQLTLEKCLVRMETLITVTVRNKTA